MSAVAAPFARADVTVTTAADLATALATSPNTVLLPSGTATVPKP